MFSGQNDLVVDTESMGGFGVNAGVGVAITNPAQRHDFGTNTLVHHLNYFSQPETLAFIRQKLGF